MAYHHKSLLASPSHLALQTYYDVDRRPLEALPRGDTYYTRDQDWAWDHQSHYKHPDRRERFAGPPSPRASGFGDLDSGEQESHQQRRVSFEPRSQPGDSRQDQRRSETVGGRAQVGGKGRDRARKRKTIKNRQQQKLIQKQHLHQPQHQHQQYRDLSAVSALITHSSNPRHQATAVGGDTSNVNAIQISDARNRLRDRFSPPQLDSAPELISDSTLKSKLRATSVGLSQRASPHDLRPASTAEPDQSQHPDFSLLIPHILVQHMSTSTNGVSATPTGPAGSHHAHAGPPRPRRLPNHVQVADAYIFQQNIDDRLKRIGVTPAREDALRLAGVQWIDQVRRALKLPVRTFDTACVYYHKFRLMHGDNEYAYVDAAAAALFAACKIEDTLKKSRDILCAAHNLLKAPSRSEHLSPDDPSFEASARTIVGHERLMLESAGFDFRSRCPQVLLIKLLKEVKSGDAAKETAWKISLDLYRTMAPLKQSTPALAFACLELAERLSGSWDDGRDEGMQETIERKYARWGLRREMVVETLLDLLDVYTSHRTSTALGPSFPLDKFLQIRIPLNEESARRRLPRYTEYIEPEQASQSGSAGERVGGYGPRQLPNGGPTGGAGGANGPGGVTGGSGRSSKNTSPKDFLSSPASGGPIVTPGTGGSASTAATSAGLAAATVAVAGGVAGGPPGQAQIQQGIRQRASERGRDGTVRFMLNPEREREERVVVGEYERFGGGGSSR